MNRVLNMLLVLGLMVLLAACGGAPPPPNADTASGGGDAAVNAAPETGGEAASLAVSGPESINLDDETRYTEIIDSNYTVRMEFSFTGVTGDGSDLYREIILSGERNIDPPASYFRMDPNDPAVMDGIEYIEIADLDGIDYVNVPGLGCSVFSNNEFNNPFDTMLDEGGMLMGNAQKIGSNETVNGVLVDVYAVTGENLDMSDPTSWDIVELQEGRAYIAQADGRVIRLMFSGRGYSELLTGNGGIEGDVFYQLDFTPTSESFDIQPPEDCATTVEDAAWPTLSDAGNITVTGPLYTYSTDFSLEEIIAFYKTEMANLGYTLTEELVYPTIASLNFESGGKMVVVNMGPDTTETAAYIVLIATAP